MDRALFWQLRFLNSRLQARKNARHDSLGLGDRHEVIAFKIREALHQTIRPMDLKVGVLVVANPKVQPAIVYRIEARLRHHCLCLYFFAISRDHT